MGTPIGYMAFGYDTVSGVVALHDYTGATIKDVHVKIFEKAKSEGYRGTIEQRLQELGWTVHQIYAYPLKVIGYITPTTQKNLDKAFGTLERSTEMKVEKANWMQRFRCMPNSESTLPFPTVGN